MLDVRRLRVLRELADRGTIAATAEALGYTPPAVSQQLAARHYAEHEGKPFYPGLLNYITSAPVVVACVEGTSAVQMVRNTVGATNPLNSAPGTIRGDLALDIGRNLIHASDAPATADRELALWFNEGELVGYPRETDRWIFE